MSEVKPVVEAGSTKAYFRGDLTPPDPIDAATSWSDPWIWNVDAPKHLLWTGEGPRCEAFWPPNSPGSPVQCELIDKHSEQDWPCHWVQRSSV